MFLPIFTKQTLFSFFKTKVVCLFDQTLDVSINLTGEEVPGVAFDWGAIGGDEELLKVPGDVGSLDGFPDEKLWVSHQVLGVVAGGGKTFL